MADFADYQKRRRPRTRTVVVPLDGQLADDIADLQRQIAIAEQQDALSNDPDVAPGLRRQLRELTAQAAETVGTFTFRELTRPDYRALVEQHPDPAGAKRWNEDTFAPALISACSVDPELTVEQATEIWNGWGASVASTLFGACYELNEVAGRVPFGVAGSKPTRS